MAPRLKVDDVACLSPEEVTYIREGYSTTYAGAVEREAAYPCCVGLDRALEDSLQSYPASIRAGLAGTFVAFLLVEAAHHGTTRAPDSPPRAPLDAWLRRFFDQLSEIPHARDALRATLQPGLRGIPLRRALRICFQVSLHELVSREPLSSHMTHPSEDELMSWIEDPAWDGFLALCRSHLSMPLGTPRMCRVYVSGLVDGIGSATLGEVAELLELARIGLAERLRAIRVPFSPIRLTGVLAFMNDVATEAMYPGSLADPTEDP